MKKLGLGFIALLILGLAVPAMAVDLSFHGDMNNRFLLYHNHVDFAKADTKGTLDDGTVSDNFAEIKYRFWFDAASDDGKVKGVFATEIGGLRFGESGKMQYSGDQIVMEVRWAYLDFQLPMVEQKSRLKMGLLPFKVNTYKWAETVGAVDLYGDAGSLGYELAWARPHEVQVTDKDDDREDSDGIYGRLNFKQMDDLDLGVFVLYEWGDTLDADSPADFGSISSRDWEVKNFAKSSDLGLWTIGVDGGMDMDNIFLKWDLMYQTGSIDDVSFTDYASGMGNSGDFDVSAYFLHFDAGMKFGNSKVTYTFWYSSGDDDPEDKDFDAFVSTDVDIDASIALMEGSYADDDYFTERPYIMDKGFMMNKLALDSKLSDKMTVGAALLYMMTAEDIEYYDNQGRKQSDDSLGFEIDAYMKYMLYSNVEFAINAGYLFADDAMDFFEVESIRDGSSDEDIFLTSARVRYKF